MKLMNEFEYLPKDNIYELYSKIVINHKEYEKVSRNKMIESIMACYKEEDFIYALCTTKELKLLEKVIDNKLVIKDLEKYRWEIKELNKKGILDKFNYKIYDEQVDNVKLALATFKENPKGDGEIATTFMIGLVKAWGSITVENLVSIMTNVFVGLTEEVVREYFVNMPLFRFYCDLGSKRVNKENDIWEDMFYYREWFNCLDIIDCLKSENTISNGVNICNDDYQNIFYYNFPINKKTVKNMYTAINERIDRETLTSSIQKAILFNNAELLEDTIEDEELLNLVNTAIKECPSAALGGLTSKEYKKVAKDLEQYKDKVKFIMIPQNNAHLCKSAADELSFLYRYLLDYAYEKKNNESPPTGFSTHELYQIDEYLWTHKELIDDYIKDKKPNEQDKKYLLDFKKAIFDNFTIVGFERNYTKILLDNKLYMVKGMNKDIDKIPNIKRVPIYIEGALIPFKDNIVLGICIGIDDSEIADAKKTRIFIDMEKAEKVYHL